MKDISKIHPDLQRAAKKFPALTVSKSNLWLARLSLRLMRTPKTPGVLVENVHVPGQDGRQRIRLRVYRPKSVVPPTPVLVWLHGGGYVAGRPEINDANCGQYVRELGITVVSVDYRCAPEHPFPAALEDSYSVLKWVASHSEELGVDAKRIAVGGESGGGGLTAALAQLAHDRQEIKLVFQLLIYPMLDDRTVLRADVDDSCSVTWNQKSNRFGWESYLGKKCGAADVPEYAVPARRQDLTGLPPTWIGVGTVDVFHNEDMAYAQKLNACGVECDVYTVPGAFHGFDEFAPKVPVSRDFREAQISALKRSLSV